MQPLLGTDRLVLAPLTRGDLDVLLALDADPAVMRYLTGGAPSTRAEVLAALDRALDARWAGRLRSTGEFVGWFELAGGGDGEFELGYRLGRRFWGAGLATEGADALLTHAFTCLRATRVWGQTMTVNQASRRVMERCGMAFVRTFFADWGEEIDGSAQGDVEYELLAVDWSSSPQLRRVCRHIPPHQP